MLTGLRLLLKSIRFELGAVIVGAALLAAAALGFPLIAGLLVGVPLVGREIEWGTAPLAWTLARCRRRWLLGRAEPVGLVLGLVLAMPAVAAFVLEGAAEPAVAPGASLQDFGLRGVPVVARGLLAYGIAVLVGTIMGRQLPALIVASVLSVGALSLADAGQVVIVQSRPTISIPGGNGELPVGSQWITQLIRQPDGTLQRQSQDPIVGGDDVVDLVVAGSEYPAVAAIYSAMLAGVTVVLVGVSVEVVERRGSA